MAVKSVQDNHILLLAPMPAFAAVVKSRRLARAPGDVALALRAKQLGYHAFL